MQKKTIVLASILVAVLGLSIVYLFSYNVDSDATSDSDNSVTYHVSLSKDDMEGRTINLIINEIYFNQIDESHILSWSYRGLDSNLNYSPITYDSEYGDSLCTFSMKKDDNSVGLYHLTLKSLSTSKTTFDIVFQCNVKVKVVDGQISRYYDADPLYVTVKVSLNQGSDLPTGLEYKKTENDFYQIDRISMKEGEPVTLTPVISGTTSQASDFFWYAVNLPHGVSMTKDGIISGVPVESDSVGREAIVYVEDNFGNHTAFTLKIVVNINDIHISFTYYLYNGDFVTSTTAADLVYKPSQFMTQRDRIVSLLIPNLYGGCTVSVLQYDNTSNSISRSDVTSTNIHCNENDSDYFVYKLPTNGTGMYRVEITKNESSVVQTMAVFDLYVISKISAVQSEILVGSDGSS